MKYFILLLILFGFSFSQEYEDVIYLKDGSEIHGMIIEQKPNEYIKIKSGSNIFVYQMDEIDKITKEINENAVNSSDIKDKEMSFGVGFFTNKNYNLVQITKDFKISKNWAIFVAAGFGNVFGVGITGQTNYNDNGLIFGWSGGVDYEGYSYGSFSLAYQWRLGKSSNFLSLGITSAAYEYYDYYYGNTTATGFIPVISFDYRF
jgi:hypothetical protein